MKMLRNAEDVNGRTEYFNVLQADQNPRLYSHRHAPIISYSQSAALCDCIEHSEPHLSISDENIPIRSLLGLLQPGQEWRLTSGSPHCKGKSSVSPA